MGRKQYYYDKNRKLGWYKMRLDDKILREEIARAIENISLGEDNNQLNAYGMRILAAKVARGDNND